MGSFVGSKKRKGFLVNWQIVCRLVKIRDEDESVDDDDVREDCRVLHT